jgi:hypothetical protein
MEQIGWSLIDGTRREIDHWGDAAGTIAPAPNPLNMPTGQSVHGLTGAATLTGGYALVQRWLDQPQLPAGSSIAETVAFKNGRIEVTRPQVIPDPKPDEFYGIVEPDPNSPGKWLFTPYPPEEMRPRLEEFSASVRLDYEIGGQVIHDPAGDFGVPTARDIRPMVTNALQLIQSGSATTARLKAMRIKSLDPLQWGTVQWMSADLNKVIEISNQMNQYLDLVIRTENDLFNQIEVGTTTTKEQIEAAYKAMRDSAFAPG